MYLSTVYKQYYLSILSSAKEKNADNCLLMVRVMMPRACHLTGNQTLLAPQLYVWGLGHYKTKAMDLLFAELGGFFYFSAIDCIPHPGR